jgi:hypothetical protein
VVQIPIQIFASLMLLIAAYNKGLSPENALHIYHSEKTAGLPRGPIMICRTILFKGTIEPEIFSVVMDYDYGIILKVGTCQIALRT